VRRIIVLMSTAALVSALAIPAGAQSEFERSDRTTSLEAIEELKLDRPLTINDSVQLNTLSPALRGASGDQQVIVRLRGESLAESGITNESQAVRHVGDVRRSQDALIDRVRSIDPSATVIAQVQRVLNAVFVEVDASALEAIAADTAVLRVSPVGNYELDLSETVPYIGAAAVQAEGVDGTGVKVAVLDSGIDYTHADLGGPGTLEAYAAAYGEGPFPNDVLSTANKTRDGLFPTAKVVDGYDFVGEFWPDFGPLEPDDDPIDYEGHGTHVADIIGGINGVAPGVELYAVKVCASLSSSCSGVALIQGMEFSVDPNGDGKTKDRVDIINMSLGSLYGQPFDDDLSAAVDGATALGVLTVASAGNSSDLPFITGSPAAAETALSVAQTQVPSAGLQLVDAETLTGIPAVFQPWSVLPTSVISGPLQYGDGAGGNLNGCAAFAPGSLAGKVVLVDRGGCNFTLKIKNVGEAGGLVGIIGLVAPGEPFSGGDGGDRPIDIPGYMINQAYSNALKARVGEMVTVDPANVLPLAGQIVGSSARGPQLQDLRIKPEIGAPGASVSAIAGTGTGTGPFGGTSGAAPMVTGSAALVLSAKSVTTSAPGKGASGGIAVGQGLSPLEIKALLMNSAETDIDIDPFSGLAQISRIGGGEVRVDQALDAPALAYDADGFSGGLSFGHVDVADETVTLTRTVTVKNMDGERHTFTVTPGFRYAGDAASGAISVSAPSTVTIPAGKGATRTFDISITIDGTKLSGNPMNSGSQGANPAALTAAEFDGYLVLSDSSGEVSMPWHVIPRKAARVVADSATLATGGFPETIGLENTGVGTAQIDSYALVVTDENLPEGARGEQAPTPDIRGVGVNTIPVPAGFCSANESFIWAFAFDNWERQTHAIVPGISWIDLDTDQDGTPDYAVYTYSLAGLGSISDGRVVTWAAPYESYPTTLGGSSAFFFAEHATVTGNTVMLICAEQIGMSGADLLTTNVTAKAYAFDIYFGGPDDETDEFVITPLGERFYGVTSDIPGGGSGSIDVYDFGTFPGNTDELGLLLVTNGDRGTGNRGGATEDTEAVYLLTD
jgi:minor extracellular serine protease Vpr